MLPPARADPPPPGRLMTGVRRKCSRNVSHSLAPPLCQSLTFLDPLSSWKRWRKRRRRRRKKTLSRWPAVKQTNKQTQKPWTTCFLPKFKQSRQTHCYQSVRVSVWYYLPWFVRWWSAGRSPRLAASPCPWSASSGPSAWCAGRQTPPCRSWVWRRIYNEHESCWNDTKKKARPTLSDNRQLSLSRRWLNPGSCYGRTKLAN